MPAVTEGLVAMGMVATPASAVETDAFAKDEMTRWREVGREARLDLE